MNPFKWLVCWYYGRHIDVQVRLRKNTRFLCVRCGLKHR